MLEVKPDAYEEGGVNVFFFLTDSLPESDFAVGLRAMLIDLASGLLE